MREIVVVRDQVAREVRDWRRVVDLMDDTARDFDGVGTTPLPPAVRPHGQAFVAAWAAYARESSAEAGEIVASLEETLRDFDVTDRGSGELFGELLVGCPGEEPPVLPGVSLPSLADRLGPLP